MLDYNACEADEAMQMFYSQIQRVQ